MHMVICFIHRPLKHKIVETSSSVSNHPRLIGGRAGPELLMALTTGSRGVAGGSWGIFALDR